MSKAMRSLVGMVLCVTMVLSMGGWTGSAAVVPEEIVSPCFNYTSGTNTNMIISGGSADCYARAIGYTGITTKIHIKMSLQEYLALQWLTVGEWEGTFNGVSGTLNKFKTLTSSGNYRVKAVYTVYSGSASEEITSYSPEKYFTYTSP